jgi:RNA polymerase sigma factor (sigma-70 family)
MRPGDQGGDADFAAVYDEHVWRVYGFVGYRLNSRQDAEDLTQQTFERALRAWHRFDPDRGSAEAWLISIARNLLIDHYRSDRSHRPIDEAKAEAALGSEACPEEGPGLDPEVAAALDRLGDRERELIALRFGGDLTGPEIAELTGLTLANVQQILSRSLRRLRSQLGDAEAARSALRG